MAYRNWVFTWNNFTADHQEILKEAGSFVVYQHEVGKEGTDHLQGYIELQKKARLSAMKKLLPTAHWESRKGTADQAYDYCTKEDTRVAGPWEFGERKQQGARSDLIKAKKVLDDGGTVLDIADTDFAAYCKYHKSFDRYKREICPKRNWEMEVLVYWGAPGTGKTRKAFEENPSAYFKPQGEWWDGYTGQDVIILDDFYGTLPWGFLLKLLDRYPLLLPFKGGFHQMASKKIIITSNVDIDEWYDFINKPAMKVEALARRITHKTHFN